MRTPRRPESDAHTMILRVTKDMLRQGGPDKLSVDELRRKTGLTRGGFRAHFALLKSFKFQG